MTQDDALYKILSFDKDREIAIDIYLTNLKPDYNFILSKALLIHVLTLAINEVISLDELEEWAIFVDCRPEIDCVNYEDYLYALSNPALMEDGDMRDAQSLINAGLQPDHLTTMLACLTQG
jgi:hypothetical protein